MINLKNIQQTNWNQIRISILGAGKSGISAAQLGHFMGAQIFISDINPDLEITTEIIEFEYEKGNHSLKVLETDLVIISPGISDQIPIVKECIKNNIPIVSEIEFASWFTSSPILALTGSNGKTTTINLLHEMCLNDGKNSLLGGNVGIPFSENVHWELTSDINNHVHVLELSSFQLEHVVNFSPMIGAILNVSSDHMNRYKNIDIYAKTKLKIANQIDDAGWLIYNADDPIISKLITNSSRSRTFSLRQKDFSHYKLNGTKVYYETAKDVEVLFNLNETKLKGSHNLENILAAATMAFSFNISNQSIRNTITNFTPIPHRLEWIGNINQVDYFNDSKATNIAATKAAIESFDSNLILILGGQNKGKTDFEELNSYLKNRVKLIVLYGQAGKKIMQSVKVECESIYFEKFEDAILFAYEQSKPWDTILLSPACASFDQFNNYEERGDTFKNIFNKLESKN